MLSADYGCISECFVLGTKYIPMGNYYNYLLFSLLSGSLFVESFSLLSFPLSNLLFPYLLLDVHTVLMDRSPSDIPLPATAGLFPTFK